MSDEERKGFEEERRKFEEEKRRLEEEKRRFEEEKQRALRPSGGLFGGIFDLVDRILDTGISISNLAKDEKLKDKLRVDYDVHIGGLLGGKDLKGSGGFFGSLDDLLKERAEFRRKIGYRRPVRAPVRPPPEKREPAVDVHEDEQHYTVVAEVGVEEKDLTLEVLRDKVVINSPKWSQPATVNFQTSVEPEYEKVVKNGILELKLKKAKQ